MNLSGRPILFTFAFMLFFSSNSKIEEPNPPSRVFSSIVIIFLILFAKLIINFSSNGLAKRALTTQTSIFFSSFAALTASFATVPIANITKSFPFLLSLLFLSQEH